MATPKVNLRQRKGKKGISYFIDFAVKGRRYRLSAGTNKKITLEICQKKELELSLGYFNKLTNEKITKKHCAFWLITI